MTAAVARSAWWHERRQIVETAGNYSRADGKTGVTSRLHKFPAYLPESVNWTAFPPECPAFSKRLMPAVSALILRWNVVAVE
jgi:hypothetical protein